MKKFLLLLLALALLANAPTALAANGLDADQIMEAQVRGNKLVPKSKVAFAFLSADYRRAGENFTPGDKGETEAYAFWVTPFCHVINEQMTQARTGDRDFAAVSVAAQTYQLRLLLAIQNLQVEDLSDLLITVRQGETTLHPTQVRYASLQRVVESQLVRRVTWYKVGIVLDFAAEDVADKVPVAVAMTGKGAPLNFDPLGNGSKYNRYDLKRHAFAWYPLNDSL